GTWMHFHEYRDPDYSGYTHHVGQHADSSDVNKWKWISLTNFLVTDILTINGTYDNKYSSSNAAAICSQHGVIVLYNGLGSRGIYDSKPPFTAYSASSGRSRYFGLDALV